MNTNEYLRDRIDINDQFTVCGELTLVMTLPQERRWY